MLMVRMRKPHHPHPLLHRPHHARLDRTITRNRSTTPSMAQSSTQASQRHMPTQANRMHTQSHTSRSHHQREGWRWTIRRGQRTRRMRTMPQTKDTARVNRGTKQDPAHTQARLSAVIHSSRATYQQGRPPPPSPGVPSACRRGAVHFVLRESGVFGLRGF